MRDIKFRVWRKKEEQMVDHNELFALDCSNESPFLALIKGYYEDVEVMQYTGLKDRNGKEICEGDILYKVILSKAIKKTVIWDKGEFKFKYEDGRLGMIINADEQEVMGNIYEDSDLL